MKLSDVNIGDTVYFKKSNRYFINGDSPFIVTGIEKRKYKHDRVIVGDKKVNSGELTDTPCSLMGCKKCKYHKQEERVTTEKELKFWRYTCCKCGKVIEVNPANPDMKGFTQYHGNSMICYDCKYKTGGER